MSLKQINNCFVDTKKISYIGPMDRHIKHGVQKSSVTHFFLIVVDSHPVEIQGFDETKLEATRLNLIEELNRIDGYMPG